MEIFAFTNGLVQIGVIVATAQRVRSPRSRIVLFWLAGAALVCSVAGLLASVVTALPDLSGLALWAVYIGIGAAVLVGIGSALRRPGGMRFTWRQGKYQRYRSYRRI